MPHDRFLQTDQISLQIGRGVDILTRENSKIRDVTITDCPDIKKIVRAFEDSPDLN